ncbi:MAG TPA: zinc-binding dehydrogenase [Arachnia sp.]|nr:zinc-binding dehydrogenase [Arachnia sp.]
MLADGRIRLSPETRIPLAEVRRAHEQLVGGDNVGKIVLVH